MTAPRNVSTPQTRKVNGVLRMIASRSTLSPECKSENCNYKRSKWTKANLKERERGGEGLQNILVFFPRPGDAKGGRHWL